MKLKFCAKFDKTQIIEKRARFSWKNINLTFIKGWLTCDHFKCSVMNYYMTWTLMTETLILFVSIIQTFEIQNNQYWILHRITYCADRVNTYRYQEEYNSELIMLSMHDFRRFYTLNFQVWPSYYKIKEDDHTIHSKTNSANQ